MNDIHFERQLAYHAAPTLLGVKAANLFSYSKTGDELKQLIDSFQKKSVSKNLYIRILCECKNRSLLYVYNSKLLSNSLNNELTRQLLMKSGYSVDSSVDGLLQYLSERIRNNSEFPHEIGLFLGYPPEDVKGFIENKGQNFILCGCWKVYQNEEKARKLFYCYSRCRQYLNTKLNQGLHLNEILKIA